MKYYKKEDRTSEAKPIPVGEAKVLRCDGCGKELPLNPDNRGCAAFRVGHQLLCYNCYLTQFDEGIQDPER